MSQVSKRVLSPDIQSRLFQNFWELFAQIKKTHEVQIFLDDLLSPTEKIMLAKRMAIAILLARGYKHRDVSSLLKVSTTTVNKIASYVNQKTPGFQLLIQKYAHKESLSEFVKELERFFYRMSSPGKVFIEEGAIKGKLGHKRQIY
ncbi:hypothetical protein HYU92_03445 [Candidatus Curtissbacteria bacterium]|nr:hypothetical protein [Candidatus Curtissbacteria bacterium]